MIKKIVLFITIIISVVLCIIIYSEWNKKIILEIGNETLIINNKTNTYIDISTLQNENIEIKNQGTCNVKVNDVKIDNEITIDNIEISKNNKIKVEISYFWLFTKTYYINTLPSDFLDYEVNGESLYEGDYYITTYDEPYYLFKLNENGLITYYKKTNQIAFDFKKDEINGKEIYSYLEVVEGTTYKNKTYLPCKLVCMNEKYEVIDEVMYTNKDGTIQPLENHGAILLGEDHYILVTVDEIEVEKENLNDKYKKNKISNNRIEEIKDGKVLWEFQTIDYEELYDYCDMDNLYESEYVDYVHYNSSTIDIEDGNLICSFRNLDAILKIDRKTGKLIWILGGKGDQFNLTDSQKFSKQHAVQKLEDGTIVLYNNENQGDTSKIVEFKIDEENKEITNYKEYDLEHFSSMIGSAQPTDEKRNTYVICYGGVAYRRGVIEEKNVLTNEIYFSFGFKDRQNMYRVYKIK